MWCKSRFKLAPSGAGNEKYTLFVKDIRTGKQLLSRPIEVRDGPSFQGVNLDCQEAFYFWGFPRILGRMLPLKGLSKIKGLSCWNMAPQHTGVPLCVLYAPHSSRLSVASFKSREVCLQNTAGDVAWSADNATLFYVTRDEVLRPDKVCNSCWTCFSCYVLLCPKQFVHLWVNISQGTARSASVGIANAALG